MMNEKKVPSCFFYISSAGNPADLLTKALPLPKLLTLKKLRKLWHNFTGGSAITKTMNIIGERFSNIVLRLHYSKTLEGLRESTGVLNQARLGVSYLGIPQEQEQDSLTFGPGTIQDSPIYVLIRYKATAACVGVLHSCRLPVAYSAYNHDVT